EQGGKKGRSEGGVDPIRPTPPRGQSPGHTVTAAAVAQRSHVPGRPNICIELRKCGCRSLIRFSLAGNLTSCSMQAKLLWKRQRVRSGCYPIQNSFFVNT